MILIEQYNTHDFDSKSDFSSLEKKIPCKSKLLTYIAVFFSKMEEFKPPIVRRPRTKANLDVCILKLFKIPIKENVMVKNCTSASELFSYWSDVHISALS